MLFLFINKKIKRGILYAVDCVEHNRDLVCPFKKKGKKEKRLVKELRRKCPDALSKSETIQFAGPLATDGGELLIKRSITPRETNYSKCLT